MNELRLKTHKKPGRRNFLKRLWILFGCAALAELILMILSFFKPIQKKRGGWFSWPDH